jgi:phospholipase C
MSFIAKTLLLSVPFAATFAYAQTPTFQHIIVIVQENRTPDNLFGGATNNPQTWDVQPVAGAPSVELKSCIDPDHTHSPGWTNEYNHGNYNN